MDRTWEDHVVRAELVDVFESLHGRLINEAPAVVRESNLAVDDVIYSRVLSCCELLSLLLLDEIAALGALVLHGAAVEG